MAVVVLLGLLASATVWHLTQDVRQHARKGGLGSYAQADAMARAMAQRRGTTVALRFDMDTQQITMRPLQAQSHEPDAPPRNLPSSCRLERVLVAELSHADADKQEWREERSGVAEIAIAPEGHSSTYALWIAWTYPVPTTDPDASADAAPLGAWLLFSGLTGQMRILHDDEQIKQIFTHLASARGDLD